MSETKRFTGKTILVTGAAGDIGGATAIRFAREGASVALMDIADMEEILQKVTDAGASHVQAYQCDVTNWQAVEQTVNQMVKDFTRIDMLFNNAGYQGLFEMTHKYPVEDFSRVMNINVVGAFHVLRAVSVHMAEAGGGAIVNTASMAGVDGPPNMIAYGTSKFAVIGITKTASKDLAPCHIRVNSISPAFMGPGFMWQRQVDLQAEVGSQYYDSDPKVVAQQMIDQVPLRRYGAIDEIPGTVAYLMSEDASYVTGVNIPISGGI